MRGFPYSSIGKESACDAGDLGSIPGSGRSPGEGNVNPLQYSCLENPMDRGAWRATVHEVTRVRHNLANKPPPSPFSLPYTHFPSFFHPSNHHGGSTNKPQDLKYSKMNQIWYLTSKGRNSVWGNPFVKPIIMK